MPKRINFRLIATLLLSLIDDAIIIAIVIFILSQFGIQIPIWAIVILVIFIFAILALIYRSLRKNPQLGFDNMVGLSGIAIEPISRKGTVRIKGELWSATAQGEKIEAGAEILVVGQNGLQLTVIKKTVGNP